MAEAVRAFSLGSSPDNLTAWIITVARRKIIDKLRQQSREIKGVVRDAIFETLEAPSPVGDGAEIPDERLTLIFLCCHPALPEEQRIALTLHSVCGLTTGAIAKGFLVTEPTMAQRLVRAKRRIRETGIRFEMPDHVLAPERLGSVMKVIYLIFTEGYRPTGDLLVRIDLFEEAMYLGHLVERLVRAGPETVFKKEMGEILGLLALMNFVVARNNARADRDGNVKLFDQQDRGLWDQRLITEGRNFLEKALLIGGGGPYQIQAAINLLHLEGGAGQTDWKQIAALYNALLAYGDSPMVRINYAVAMSYVAGAEYALNIVLEQEKELSTSSIYYLTRGNLEERLGKTLEAKKMYELGFQLEQNGAIRKSIALLIQGLESD